MSFATVLAFAFAFAISFILTPIVYRFALRVGLTDNPDGHRKLHETPVALGGGLVVFLSLASVMALVLLIPNPWQMRLVEDWQDVVGFASACMLIVAIGLVDDRFTLRGRHKLLGQVIAAGCLMFSGLIVRRLGLFGMEVELGLLSIPFTMFWLLGAMNAMNLLDGIDGLATSLGIVLSLTIACLAALKGNFAVAAIAMILTGSLLGFLRYNLPPARMYLGDAGSMLIGLLVGAMAIRASLKGAGTVLLAAPMAVWAIPILDSSAAIIRRKLTGRSIYAADRGHLHHRLLEALGSNTKALMVIVACSVATSVGALLGVQFKSDIYAFVSCLAVIAILVVTGVFGRAELQLMFSRMRNYGMSFAKPTHGKNGARVSKVRIQGSEQWELLWETLTESAEKLCLAKVHLDMNAPALHESYVATWESNNGVDLEGCWHLELPLAADSIPLGRLLVHGQRNGGTGLDEIAQLLDLLEPFSARLEQLTRREPVVAGKA